MNNNHIIKEFFLLWSNKNFSKLDLILDPSFSFRDRLLISHLGYDKSFKHLNSRTIHAYKILNIVDGENMIFADVEVNFLSNGQHLTELYHYKFKLVSSRIINVFEELIDDSLKRIKCIVSYDGSDFFGYQKQDNVHSVQSEIEKAIFNITGDNITIHSSGRTDSKVHALNQVFHFDTTSKIDSAKWRIVLNSYLPDSILIKNSTIVPQSFHSRYDTLSKEYMYIINVSEYNPVRRNYEWFKSKINIDLLESELNKIVGIHDFRTFSKVPKNIDTIREIYSVKLEVSMNQIYIYIKGNGFLRYMVRNLVGALVDISRGDTNLDILEIMSKQDRDYAKNTAFAGGLYLKEVIYKK